MRMEVEQVRKDFTDDNLELLAFLEGLAQSIQARKMLGYLAIRVNKFFKT